MTNVRDFLNAKLEKSFRKPSAEKVAIDMIVDKVREYNLDTRVPQVKCTLECLIDTIEWRSNPDYARGMRF
jgi:hypothetical protein